MPDPHGYIYSKQIIGALDPYLCIRCTERMPQPGINKICEFCELYLTIDSPWKFLHDKVLELYKFFVAVQRKSLSAQFYFDQPRTDKGIETQLWFEDGIPGIRAQLPVVEKMYWIDEVTKEQKSMTLDGMQQELLEQVLLSQAQCHIAMLMMPDVIGQELERDGTSVPASRYAEWVLNTKFVLQAKSTSKKSGKFPSGPSTQALPGTGPTECSCTTVALSLSI